MKRLQRSVQVWGKVQGVGFRAATVRAAAAHRSLKGWVQNQPDGSVIARFSGLASDVEALTEWLKTGPVQSRVDRQDVKEEDLSSDLSEFEGLQIRY